LAETTRDTTVIDPQRQAPSAALERFALKAHHYGRLTGVSLAAHAIPDAFLLLHSGVGCKYKAAAQVSIHDWARQPHRREGWTEVGDAALIKGAATRIGPYVRSWYDRHHPAVIFVCGATFLEMTGEDLAAEVQAAGQTVPCPVRYVTGVGFDGDLFDGYADVLGTVLDLIPWQEVKPEPGHAAVVGYFFDRYEADHLANVHQLRILLGELGLTLETVLLSGQPLERLQQAARAELVIALPYAHRAQSALRQLARTGRTVVETALPMGVRGTTAWLEQVGQAAGVSPAKIRKVAGRLSGYTRQELAPLRERVLGGRSAIFAETPLAAGLADLLEAVGLAPRLIGLRDRSFGGAAALRRQLQAVGRELRPTVEVLEDPSIWLVRQRLETLRRTREIQVAVGSAAEIGGARPAPGQGDAIRRGARPAPGQGDALRRGDLAGDAPWYARLLLGFPATGYHALHPVPTLGYGGQVAQAHRLLESLFGGHGG
jgi:nitrogenase molybdenum-iron protein alpha/beta subunit